MSYGSQLQIALDTQAALAILGDVSDNLTATGSTQTDALLLTATTNVVRTTPTGAGVLLPSVLPGSGKGDRVTVANFGAHTLSCYPPSGGTLQGGAVDNAILLQAGASVDFICINVLDWIVDCCDGVSFSLNRIMNVPTGSIVLHGNAPTLTRSEKITISPLTGSIVIDGEAPTLGIPCISSAVTPIIIGSSTTDNYLFDYGSFTTGLPTYQQNLTSGGIWCKHDTVDDGAPGNVLDGSGRLRHMVLVDIYTATFLADYPSNTNVFASPANFTYFPFGIDPDGSVYMRDGSGPIYKCSPAGGTPIYFSPAHDNAGSGVAIDSSGNMWGVNQTSNKPVRMSSINYGSHTCTETDCATAGYLQRYARNAGGIAGRVYGLGPSGEIRWIDISSGVGTEIISTTASAIYVVGDDGNIYYTETISAGATTLKKVDQDGNLLGSLVLPADVHQQWVGLYSNGFVWCHGANATSYFYKVNAVTMMLVSSVPSSVASGDWYQVLGEYSPGVPVVNTTANNGGLGYIDCVSFVNLRISPSPGAITVTGKAPKMQLAQMFRIGSNVPAFTSHLSNAHWAETVGSHIWTGNVYAYDYTIVATRDQSGVADFGLARDGIISYGGWFTNGGFLGTTTEATGAHTQVYATPTSEVGSSERACGECAAPFGTSSYLYTTTFLDGSGTTDALRRIASGGSGAVVDYQMPANSRPELMCYKLDGSNLTLWSTSRNTTGNLYAVDGNTMLAIYNATWDHNSGTALELNYYAGTDSVIIHTNASFVVHSVATQTSAARVNFSVSGAWVFDPTRYGFWLIKTDTKLYFHAIGGSETEETGFNTISDAKFAGYTWTGQVFVQSNGRLLVRGTSGGQLDEFVYIPADIY